VTPQEQDLLLTLLGNIGGNAALLAVIWALVTGRLVTKGHHEEVKSILEERIGRIKNEQRSFPFPDPESDG